MESGMESGVVKYFLDAKGWGFIIGPDARDVFVHHSVIVMDGFRKLTTGQAVQFEAFETPRGRQAKRVVPVSLLEEAPDAEA